MFRFAWPEVLYLLWALLPLAALWWWLARQEDKRVRQFAGPKLGPALTQQNSRGKRVLGQLGLMLSIACLVLGMARPQVALTQKLEKSEGLDIMLVMDVSRSMDATDVSPSRLERGKRALFYLADHLSQHRIGIIPFAGTAFLNCPATQDMGTLKLLIDSLQTSNQPVPGTDVGNALDEAIKAFKRTGARQRAIVLVSDGENFGPAPFPKVVQAAKTGIHTYALGVGSENGFSIPADWQQPENQGAPAGKGKKPMTRLQERTLQKIAMLGQGAYQRLTSGGQEEAWLVEEINKLETMELYSETNIIWEEYYPLAALLALIFLLAEFLLGRRRGGPKLKELWQRLKALAAISCLAIGLLPGNTQAAGNVIDRGVEAFQKKNPKEAEQYFNQAREDNAGDALAEFDYGCALLAQKKLEAAYQAFTRAQPYAKGSLAQDTWYNFGYSAFYLGLETAQAEKWQEAAEGFKQCLLLNPQDDDARYNLEIVLRELKRHTQSAAPRREQTQGKKQGQAPGSGANKPGSDQENQSGRENEKAPPSESQQKSSQEQEQKTRPSTSEQQQGHKQRGMSQEDALRTLRSLEAEESSMQKDWSKDNKQQDTYRGPGW